MAITPRVRKQMFRAGAVANTSAARELIRLPSTRSQPLSPTAAGVSNVTGPAWTPAEHERFLEALELFPSGPWRRIAEYVGSKTARQTMTHAQKYRQKIARRARGLRVGAPPRKLIAAVGVCARGGGGDGGTSSSSSSESSSASSSPHRCVASEELAVRVCGRERLLLPSPASPSPPPSSPSFSPSSLSEPDACAASSAMLLENVVLDALFAEAEFFDGSACGSLLCDGDDAGGVGSLFDSLVRGVDSLAMDQQLMDALLDDVALRPASPSPSSPYVSLYAFACGDPSAAMEDSEMSAAVLDELVVECGDDILCWLTE